MSKTKKIFIALLFTVLMGIFICGTHEVFILSYIFVFIIMAARCLYSAATINTRLLYIFAYGVTMVLQILFTTLLTYNYEQDSQGIFVFLKLVSTAIIIIPLCIEKMFFSKHDEAFLMPSVQDFRVITYAQLAYDKDRVVDAVQEAKRMCNALSKENISQAFSMLPNHSSFRYVNDGKLTDAYFETAFASVSDNHVYIVLSDTGSPASEIISVFTRRRFNHVSLSFDKDLKTVISYNGGENVFPPGMNAEMI